MFYVLLSPSELGATSFKKQTSFTVETLLKSSTILIVNVEIKKIFSPTFTSDGSEVRWRSQISLFVVIFISMMFTRKEGDLGLSSGVLQLH